MPSSPGENQPRGRARRKTRPESRPIKCWPAGTPKVLVHPDPDIGFPFFVPKAIAHEYGGEKPDAAEVAYARWLAGHRPKPDPRFPGLTLLGYVTLISTDPHGDGVQHDTQ